MILPLPVRRRLAIPALGLLAFVAGAAPAALTAQEATAPAPVPAVAGRVEVDDLRALLARVDERFETVGLAVAVIEGGEVVFEGGIGTRGEGGEPVTERSIFNIASCTKAFTAACVARLVGEKKLGWDDLVIDHVPEFRLGDPWITRQLTVRDLLCHRSGLKTFEGDLLWYGADRTDEELLAALPTLPLTQRFREQFGYQNLLYMVAGLVVERVSGQAWEEYVHASFLDPLGMDGTGAFFGDLPEGAPLAWPHVKGKRAPGVREIPACRPAASLWSSAHDLTRWVRFLLDDGQLDGQPHVARRELFECWRPHTSLANGPSGAALNDFRSYGLGWFLTVEEGRKVVEHDGGMPGYISKVLLIPEQDFGLILLNNDTDGVVNAGVRNAVLTLRSKGLEAALGVVDRYGEIAQRMARRDAREAANRIGRRQEGTSPSLDLEAYAGTYRDEVLGDATVSLEDGVLHLRVHRSPGLITGKLMHWHHDVFSLGFDDVFVPYALVEFRVDGRGRVAGFGMECPIPDFDFAALDFRRVETAGR